MIKKALLPADSYIVVNKTILNDQDRKLLINLYQPIIGSCAINLYFSLWADLDKAEIMSFAWTHHHLLANMAINVSELVEAREKLEAIGLLKTYFKEGHINQYVYLLFSPMNANEYFNNPILNTILYNTLGKDEYNKLISYYKIPRISLTDYEEITCSLNEVYEVSSLIGKEINDVKKVSKNKLRVTIKLDIDEIITSIPEEILNHKSITKEIRELIVNLSFVYDLNEDDLNHLIRNSLNELKSIDKEQLRNNARKYYQFENGDKLPTLIYRNQPEYLKKPIGDTSNRAKMIYKFENTSPYDFLASKYKSGRPTSSDLKIAEYLLIDLELKPGVVNVLIDYVLKINNNKLTKSYVEVIASQWKKSKLESVEQAMDFAEKEYKSKKNKNVVSKREATKPEWFDKDTPKKEISIEKKKELEEMFKEFR